MEVKLYFEPYKEILGGYSNVVINSGEFNLDKPAEFHHEAVASFASATKAVPIPNALLLGSNRRKSKLACSLCSRSHNVNEKALSVSNKTTVIEHTILKNM